jgi:arylsulfatase
LFWEHEGNAAVRDGEWKITRLGYTAPWELYNMTADRTEQHNLAADHPEKVKSMAAQWDAWATRASVKPWPPGIGYPHENQPALDGKKKRGGKKKQ